MTNPLEYIHQHPHLAKQIIGLDLVQLEFLMVKAIAKNQERLEERELQKTRVNKKNNSLRLAFSSTIIESVQRQSQTGIQIFGQVY